jgi:solute:Na+ symporter, SSS family
MLAALASTVDTHLNWGSSYWTNDIYKRFVCEKWRKTQPSDRSLVWVARGANLLILAIALVVMTRLGSIASAWRTSLLFGAGMGGVLVLRWLWWRVTAWGELAAIAASAVLAPILLHVFDAETADSEALRLLAMFAASTATGIVTSMLTARAPTAGMVAFYRRTRPPGFWGPVAGEAGHEPHADRQRLLTGALAVAVAALSLFSLLTAFASLVAGSPAPTWFPWRAPWIAILFVVGLGLVPIWRKLLGTLDRDVTGREQRAPRTPGGDD